MQALGSGPHPYAGAACGQRQPPEQIQAEGSRPKARAAGVPHAPFQLPGKSAPPERRNCKTQDC